MKYSSILTTMALGVIAAASMPLAAQKPSRPTTPRHPINIPQYKPNPSTSITIKSPKWGETVTGEDFVQVSVVVGKSLDSSSVKLRLNGKDVTAGIHQQNCTGATCTFTANVSAEDGLRDGGNRMLASAHGGKRMSIDTVHFDHQEASLTDTPPAQYLPDAIGFQLNGGGVDPWVQINTGYATADPAGSASPVTLSTPYPNSTIASGCDSTWQVMELNRQNPAQLINKSCYNDAGSLQAYLHSLASSANGTELVAVGTVFMHSADANLNTTDIGGTDYTQVAPNLYPQGYAILGVPGAPAGSAYENFYTSSEPHHVNPFANGILVSDGINYNYIAGDPATFQVKSNIKGATTVTLHYAGTDHTFTSPTGQNGLWLLILNRDTLHPVDEGATYTCVNSGSSSCGTVYPTGSTDAATANAAATALSAALAAVTPRQEVVLTAVGQAFASAAPANILKRAVDNLGGAGYILATLTSGSTAYSLVSHGFTLSGADGDCKGQPSCVSTASGATGLNPFSQGVALSSTAMADKGQTGFLSGVMNRDTQGLYYVTMASQEDADMQATYRGQSVNFDYHLILGQNTTNWPDTDTPGHYAAYHYISQLYMNKKWNYFGSHASDVRYYYNNLSMNVGQYASDITPSSDYGIYPGDGYGFTAAEQQQVVADLHNELMNVNDTFDYMGPNGIGQIVQASITENLGTTVVDAANQLTKGQIADASKDIHINSSPTNWMSVVSGIANIGAAVVGVGFPPAGVALGVVSGALGAAGSVGYHNGDHSVTYPTPASYQNGFDTTFSNINQNAQDLQTDLVHSYYNSVSIVSADAGKLNVIGAKIQDTDSGWSLPSSTTMPIATADISDGIKRSIYLQTLPQIYSLDTFKRVDVTNPQQIARIYSKPKGGEDDGNNVYCRSVYSGTDTELAAWAWAGWDSVTPSANYPFKDMFVIGGRIDFDNTTGTVEAFPSATLLSTLFTSGGNSVDYSNRSLNLPQYFLEADSNFLPLRDGKITLPNSGATVGLYTNDPHEWCYAPGCDGDDSNNKCQYYSRN